MISECLPIAECIFELASDVGQKEPTSAFGMVRLFVSQSGTQTKAKKMKFFLSFLLLGGLSFCNQSKRTATVVNRYECIYDSTFEYHFGILDSVSNSYLSDTIYPCCSPTIKFMEDKTGIESLTDGTYIGKIKFTKFDLLRWHQWYESHKK